MTFTNKATAEMKSRILDDLHRRASDDPRAREVLLNLLHDYGAFAVSTIDRFFQQALKAFSREIGQFADYQIELDRKSLIREAMDRILDSLTEEDEDVIRWINANVSERLQQGEKLRIEDSLYRMGELLKSEEHRELAERCGVDDLEAFSKQRLASIRGICDRVIREFREAVAPYGIEAAPGEMIKFEGRKRLLKANPELAEIKDSRYAAYLTAFTLDKLVFSLGLAGEFYHEFDALLKEKNVMSLDESNTILRESSSTAPTPPSSMRSWASVMSISCSTSSRTPPTSSGRTSSRCSGERVEGRRQPDGGRREAEHLPLQEFRLEAAWRQGSRGIPRCRG